MQIVSKDGDDIYFRGEPIKIIVRAAVHSGDGKGELSVKIIDYKGNKVKTFGKKISRRRNAGAFMRSAASGLVQS